MVHMFQLPLSTTSFLYIGSRLSPFGAHMGRVRIVGVSGELLAITVDGSTTVWDVATTVKTVLIIPRGE